MVVFALTWKSYEAMQMLFSPRSQVQLGNENKVAAGFSLRLHRLGSLCHQRFT
jgi:hypothetical protein